MSWRDVLAGAVIAALVWAALLTVGTWFVDRQIRGASDVYGFFALVIGLLSWLYVGAQMTLLAAEVNVVRARRLWPRSLLPPSAGEPDRRSLAGQAAEQVGMPGQEVDVRFGPPSPKEGV